MKFTNEILKFQKEVLEIWGIIYPIAMVALINFTFFSAYSSPDKCVIIHVNSIGEANFEAVLLPVISVIAIYSYCKNYRRRNTE